MMTQVGGIALSLLLLGSVQEPSSHGPEIGSNAPDFILEDSQGKAYRLSDFRGQKVVLEFFRSGGW